MIRRLEVRHDCPTEHASVNIPTNVTSATFPWRCTECGQRFWCTIKSGGNSASFERVGRASRKWRRQHRPVVRIVPPLRMKNDA